MKPREPRENDQRDMFRSRLDQVLYMDHEKVVLANSSPFTPRPAGTGLAMVVHLRT